MTLSRRHAEHFEQSSAGVVASLRLRCVGCLRFLCPVIVQQLLLAGETDSSLCFDRRPAASAHPFPHPNMSFTRITTRLSAVRGTATEGALSTHPSDV